MSRTFVIIALIILLMFLSLLFLFYNRRAKIIKKIQYMPKAEKYALLREITESFGYAYVPQWDIFTSRIDAWQREFGYCAFYDKSAVHFHMVLDCLPVYFDYQGETWLIEFWKGQYGINTGCEIGVYHAGRILKQQELSSTLFQCADDSQMLEMSLSLFVMDRLFVKLSAKHWWLTAFSMGTFCSPSDLTLCVSLNFPNPEMAGAFLKGLFHAGYMPEEVERNRCKVAFCLHPSGRVHGLPARSAQWANRFWCRVYLSVTRPFHQSVDRLLYLYEFLPFAFRKMLHIRAFQRNSVKERRP